MAKLIWTATTLALIAVVLVVATLIRYQSLDPCDWLARDMADKEGLTVAMAEAKVRAGFLLGGIVQPDVDDCLLEWWAFRGNSAAGAQ